MPYDEHSKQHSYIFISLLIFGLLQIASFYQQSIRTLLHTTKRSRRPFLPSKRYLAIVERTSSQSFIQSLRIIVTSARIISACPISYGRFTDDLQTIYRLTNPLDPFGILLDPLDPFRILLDPLDPLAKGDEPQLASYTSVITKINREVRTS